MNEADVRRATQMATRRNTSAAWRELARELMKAGKREQAKEAQDKANEILLKELETKPSRRVA